MEDEIMEKANEIAIKQEQIGKSMVQILSNARKDSQSRKTEEYIQKREDKLIQHINEARKNHTKFQELKISEHTYLSTKYYEAIEDKFKEVMEYLQNCPKAEEQTKTPASGQKASTSKLQKYEQKISEQGIEMEQEQLIRIKKQQSKLNTLLDAMEVAEDSLKEDNMPITYERESNNLQKQWSAILELNDDIEAHKDTFEHEYFTDNKLKEIEKEYIQVLVKLEKKIMQNSTEKPNIKLPKIELPYFSGGYEAWSTFYDIFQKVIHANTSITKTEKMQYLKTHVKGEASKLIQHLLIKEENYDSAWEILIKRYQNKRLIITKLIDQIINLPMMQKENLRQLRHIHNTVHECLKAIENQGISTESWGPMIERWVSQKWDPETNKLYEQTISNNHELQSLSELLEFLEKRCQAIESTNTRGNNYYYQTKSSTFQHYGQKSNSSSSKCICCNEAHRIYECSKFKNMTIAERKGVVKEKKGCFNCLNQHDFAAPCLSNRSCHICRRRHHTLLHEEWKAPQAPRYDDSKPRQFNSNSGRNQSNQYRSYQTWKNQPTNTRQSNTNTEDVKNQISKNSYSTNHNESIVLLATALVCTTSQQGNMEYLRVLIDSGSQAALISEEAQAAQRIGNLKQKILAEITGISDNSPKVSKFKMQATIKPRFPSEFSLNVNFIILPKLTKNHPNEQLDMELPQSWNNKLLADPTFNLPGPIDAILGAEELGRILQNGFQKINAGIISQETKLGWILSGGITQESHKPVEIINIYS